MGCSCSRPSNGAVENDEVSIRIGNEEHNEISCCNLIPLGCDEDPFKTFEVLEKLDEDSIYKTYLVKRKATSDTSTTSTIAVCNKNKVVLVCDGSTEANESDNSNYSSISTAMNSLMISGQATATTSASTISTSTGSPGRSIVGTSSSTLLYTLKRYDLKSMKASQRQRFKNEMHLMTLLNHPNVVRTYHVYDSDKTSVGSNSKDRTNQTTGVDDSIPTSTGQRNYSSLSISMLMEYCSGGDLSTRRGPYREDEARRILIQLIQGIEYLHNCGMTHGDLNFQNVAFESTLPTASVKIRGLDLACQQHLKGIKLGNNNNSDAIACMSPELIRGAFESQNAHMQDMWSIGVIAYQLLCGELPFTGDSNKTVASKIAKANYTFQGSEWASISQQAKYFVWSLLQIEPDLRMGAKEALRSTWLSGIQQKVSAHTILTLTNAPHYSEHCSLPKDDECNERTFSSLLRSIVLDATCENEFVQCATSIKENLIDSEFVEQEVVLIDPLKMSRRRRDESHDFLTDTLQLQTDFQKNKVANMLQRANKGYITADEVRKILGTSSDDSDVWELVEQLLSESRMKHEGKISLKDFKIALKRSRAMQV